MSLQNARFNCLSAASGLFFALSVGAVWAQDGSAPSDDVLQATEPVEDVEQLVIAEEDLEFLVDLFLADPAVFLETRDGGEIEAVIAQAVFRDPQTITAVLVAIGQTTDAGIQSAIANGIASAATRLSQEGRATEVATILASVATQSSTAFLESVTGNLAQLTEQAGVDGSQDEGDPSRVEGDDGNADILSPQPVPLAVLGGVSDGTGGAVTTTYSASVVSGASGSGAIGSTGQTGPSGGGVSSGGAGDAVSPVN
jgi:hypothetical protein